MEALQEPSEPSEQSLPAHLFGLHFTAPMAELGIDAGGSAGNMVLTELERRLPQGISPQQAEEVARNLRKLALTMAEDAYAVFRATQIKQLLDQVAEGPGHPFPAIPEDEQSPRLHDWSLVIALRRLCPLFPFC